MSASPRRRAEDAAHQPELTDAERQVATDRAMREARITAGLHHPHAVTVFDVVEHEGQPCIVMQLIDSTPLSTCCRSTARSRRARRRGSARRSAPRWPPRTACGSCTATSSPGNILITRGRLGDDQRLRHLARARRCDDHRDRHDPRHARVPRPEVARGQPSSFASDVFSLGSTLYAMLEGTPPFGADNNAIALLHRVARGEHPAPEHAGRLAPLLLEMLSPTPSSDQHGLKSRHAWPLGAGRGAGG